MTVYDTKMVEMHKKLKPWFVYSQEHLGPELSTDAPEEIKELYKKWKNTKPIMPDLC